MILVTGASGTVGSTVLAEVAKSGAPCRGMYRSEADAAKAPSSTETAIADFADAASLAAALRGISSVFLVCSPIPELVMLESNMIAACESAGIERIVLNSALGAGDYGKSFPSWHRQVEERLKAASGSAHCILRPNSFMQNIVSFYAPGIRTQGSFYSALGSARISYLDVRDIAKVAANALRGAHDGKTLELNGPEALTSAEIAEKVTRQTGVTARYVEISEDAQRNAMRDQGMPEWLVTALLELQEYYTGGRGGVVDDLLERLLAQKPITMDRFLAENARAFLPGTAGN